MTTSPVMGITDELVAELEAVAHTGKGEFMIECAQVHALLAERADLLRDRERLNKLDQLCMAYGFQDIHEGNRWMIEGPYRDIRTAIDDIKD